MQDNLTLARPYAKAAFEYALEHKSIAQWQQFFVQTRFIMSQEETRKFLRHPDVSEQLIYGLIQGVLGKNLEPAMDHFLKLLCERKRLSLLPTIAELFYHYQAEYEKQLDVDVYAAVALTAEQREALAKKLEIRMQRKVAIKEHLDPELLGGVFIRAGDVVIDDSLRGRLNRLTYALTD